MKKVLIALDYEPTAQKVAEAGFSLAKSMNAEVILLHIISDPKLYSSTKHIKIMGFAGVRDKIPLKPDSIDELKKVAQQFLEKSKELLDDITIKVLLKEGVPAESILTAAEDIHADLIVMGSHSRKVSSRIIMGRVTKGVLQNTVRPLLIIPTKIKTSYEKEDLKILPLMM
jgi:nucleotide-binding universal stress UspA family protein